MKILNLGRVDYSSALVIQEELVEKLRDENEEECLIFCSHDSIVTLGKKTMPEDLGSWQGKILQVTRGGSATYHGPSQVVCYPIIRLKKRNNDIFRYLRCLEEAMVETFSHYGVKAHGDEKSTGVWVGTQKIASIGIAIKRGVTYHGLAINLFEDEDAFVGINPCGMQTKTMISLEEILNKSVSRIEFERYLEKYLQTQLSNCLD